MPPPRCHICGERITQRMAMVSARHGLKAQCDTCMLGVIRQVNHATRGHKEAEQEARRHIAWREEEAIRASRASLLALNERLRRRNDA